jgi:hypothetical protein
MKFFSYTANTATYSHRVEPKHLSPLPHLLSNHRPLSSHAAAAGQQHMASTAADTAGSLSHTPHTHSVLFHSWTLQFTPQEYLEELRILLFQRALYNYHAVMYLEKEIIISFFIISISSSNLYMPMIWLYIFLLDFLIPFLCDPDLQCMQATHRV